MDIIALNSVSVSKIEGKNAQVSICFKVRIKIWTTPIIINIIINPLLAVISKSDDTKPSHHSDALGRHQIVIFIQVVNDAYPCQEYRHNNTAAWKFSLCSNMISGSHNK